MIGWDCAVERAGGTMQVFGKDVTLCGPDAQYFVERTTPLPEPEPVSGMPPAVQRQIDIAKSETNG